MNVTGLFQTFPDFIVEERKGQMLPRSLFHVDLLLCSYVVSFGL